MPALSYVKRKLGCTQPYEHSSFCKSFEKQTFGGRIQIKLHFPQLGLNQEQSGGEQ